RDARQGRSDRDAGSRCCRSRCRGRCARRAGSHSDSRQEGRRRAGRVEPPVMKRVVAVLILLLACSRGEQTTAAPAAPTAKTAAVGTEVGNRMPAYQSTYLDGTAFDVAAQKDSVVLLNAWATWCGPCRFETPELERLHQKYSARGFKVVGVSVDDTGVP